MQDRNGLASDEGSGAIVAEERVVAKRRVSFALAVPIVLLCGGIGAAAGCMFPLQTLMTGGDHAGKRTDENARQSVTPDATSAAPSMAVVVVEPPPSAGQSTDWPAPMTERAAVEQTQPALPPTAAPTKGRRDLTEGEAPSTARKKQRRLAERRERHVARPAAKAKRTQAPDVSQERATQKRSSTIISQIPVLGPVFGLLLP